MLSCFRICKQIDLSTSHQQSQSHNSTNKHKNHPNTPSDFTATNDTSSSQQSTENNKINKAKITQYLSHYKDMQCSSTEGLLLIDLSTESFNLNINSSSSNTTTSTTNIQKHQKQQQQQKQNNLKLLKVQTPTTTVQTPTTASLKCDLSNCLQEKSPSVICSTEIEPKFNIDKKLPLPIKQMDLNKIISNDIHFQESFQKQISQKVNFFDDQFEHRIMNFLNDYELEIQNPKDKKSKYYDKKKQKLNMQFRSTTMQCETQSTTKNTNTANTVNIDHQQANQQQFLFSQQIQMLNENEEQKIQQSQQLLQVEINLDIQKQKSQTINNIPVSVQQQKKNNRPQLKLNIFANSSSNNNSCNIKQQPKKKSFSDDTSNEQILSQN